MTKTKRSWYCSTDAVGYAEAARYARDNGLQMIEVSLRDAKWNGNSLENFRDYFPDKYFDELEAWLQDNDQTASKVWFGSAVKPIDSGMKPNERLCLNLSGQDVVVTKAASTQVMLFIAEIVEGT